MYVKYLVAPFLFLSLLIGVFIGSRTPIFDENCAGLTLLSPLLSCAKAKSLAVQAGTIEEAIVALKATRSADSVSVYFQYLEDRSSFSINTEQPYNSGSLGKVLNLIWFYRQAETDPALLERDVYYESGAMPFQQQFSSGGVIPGHSYTFSELVDSSIINSDNNALMFLNSHMGEERSARAYADFNFTDDMSAPRTNAKSYAVLFRMLYDSSYLTPASSEKALELLSKTTFSKGLRAGVPQNVRIAHKYGEWGTMEQKELHDCGIVYAPEHPYILCIMTAGQDWDALASTIADISELVYLQVSR